MLPFDKMPYTNFHELNLAYFIVHFREIFAEWETLYNNMVSWREQTDADLTLWKTDTLNAIEDYERDLTDAWDAWKAETALDITDWKNETLDALDAWKTAFQTLFDSTFSNLSQIKTDAEAARDAAVAAQNRAEAAAATLVLDSTLTSATQAAQAKAAGDAIDDLNDFIDVLDSLLIYHSPNIYNKNYTGTVKGVTFTNGLAKDYHISQYGEFVEASGENMSYPIEIDGGKTLYTYRVNKNTGEFTLSATSRVCFYDRDMNFISGSYKTGQTTITAPVNARYVVYSAEFPSYQCFGNDVLTVVSYDSTLTEYEEYRVQPNVTRQDVIDLKDENNDFNSAHYPPAYNWTTKLSAYSALYNDTDKIESYCFFTDQHLFQTNGGFQMSTFETYISELQKVYNSSPCSFIVSGGDWLNNGDTKAQACFNLGYVDGVMRSMFGRHYMIVGNHDTNYQGYEYVQDNTKYRDCMLSYDTLKNLWFKEQGKTYYSFDGNYAKYYVLNTGIDWWNFWTQNDEDKKMEQIRWLANKLNTDDPEHATILMHITIGMDDQLTVFADAVGKIISAFNSHIESESINGQRYDFSGTTGHIDYVLSGHRHADILSTLGGVPLIVTTHFQDGNKPTFDLVLADYDNMVLHLVRCGTGEDRNVNM